MMVLHSCAAGSVGIGCKETIIESVAVLLLTSAHQAIIRIPT